MRASVKNSDTPLDRFTIGVPRPFTLTLSQNASFRSPSKRSPVFQPEIPSENFTREQTSTTGRLVASPCEDGSCYQIVDTHGLEAAARSGRDWDLFAEGHALDLVGVQCWEHLCGKTPDLLDKHLVRQDAAIEGHLHGAGARTLGRVDDPPCDLVRGTPRHVLGLALDIGHRQAAKILAGELRGAQILGTDAIGRPGTRIAGLAQPLGLGEVAVAEQCAIEIELK
jgi:hypothetical protein